MVKFNFLGRGSAFNKKENNNSCFYKKDGKMLLIDCGEDIFKTILKKDVLNGVKEILIIITHMHSDHVGSLSSLLFYLKYKRGIIANVFFPLKEVLLDFLEKNGNLKDVEYKFFDLDENQFFDDIFIGYQSVNHTGVIEKVNDGVVVNGVIKNCRKEKVFDSYLYTFLEGEDITVYSGDTYENIFQLFTDGDEEDDPHFMIYQDVCLTDYEGNVHLSFRKLKEGVPKMSDRAKIYCMHIDNSDELVDMIKENGFNIVEVI